MVLFQRREVRNDRKRGISIDESSVRRSVSGLPMITSGAPFSVWNSPSARRERRRLVASHLARLAVAGREDLEQGEDERADHPAVRQIRANCRCRPSSA